MSEEPVFDDSWPTAARALVSRAIDRHGGWARWARLDTVSVSLVELRGFLPWAKGYGRTFTLPRSLTAFPKRWQVAFGDGADHATNLGRVGLFADGDVTLYDAKTTAVTAESAQHRRRFVGLGKLWRWRTIDALYFFGYAFATYTSVPFILPRLRYRGPVSGRWRGERLTGVRVEFPQGAHVHSRRQSFYFDASGLLRRNDYTADIVGPFATGAHGWDDFGTFEGFQMPARRTVLCRLGTTTLPFPLVLGATFDRFAVGLDRR
jgi:hypothetical protein